MSQLTPDPAADCTCSDRWAGCCGVEMDPDFGFCPVCRDHAVPEIYCEQHGIDKVDDT